MNERKGSDVICFEILLLELELCVKKELVKKMYYEDEICDLNWFAKLHYQDIDTEKV